jgi:uncharacterized protein YegP (UPF0339 family)
MVRFVIHKKSEKCYFVVLLNVDGDIILRGRDCDDVLVCYSLIDSIRNNASDFSKYELKDSHEGKFFFSLLGSDGKDIAQSTIFETPAKAYSGIEFIRRNISFANVIGHRFVA